MDVSSSDDVAHVEILDPFGRGLEVQFYFLYVCGKDVPPQGSLASCEERSQREKVGVRVALVEGLHFPGEFGLYSRTSTIRLFM